MGGGNKEDATELSDNEFIQKVTGLNSVSSTQKSLTTEAFLIGPKDVEKMSKKT